MSKAKSNPIDYFVAGGFAGVGNRGGLSAVRRNESGAQVPPPHPLP